eukprot:390108-Pyramimonas_sp.AAC.1
MSDLTVVDQAKPHTVLTAASSTEIAAEEDPFSPRMEITAVEDPFSPPNEIASGGPSRHQENSRRRTAARARSRAPSPREGWST